MDSEKIKKIVIVVVLAVVGVLLGSWFLKGGSARIQGTGSVPEGEKVWVKCSNKACGASYEMALKDYYQKVEKKVTFASIPPIDCEKCGKESVFKAKKCKSCGEVFFPNARSSDGMNKCPKCGSIETDNP